MMNDTKNPTIGMFLPVEQQQQQSEAGQCGTDTQRNDDGDDDLLDRWLDLFSPLQGVIMKDPNDVPFGSGSLGGSLRDMNHHLHPVVVDKTKDLDDELAARYRRGGKNNRNLNNNNDRKVDEIASIIAAAIQGIGENPNDEDIASIIVAAQVIEASRSTTSHGGLRGNNPMLQRAGSDRPLRTDGSGNVKEPAMNGSRRIQTGTGNFGGGAAASSGNGFMSVQTSKSKSHSFWSSKLKRSGSGSDLMRRKTANGSEGGGRQNQTFDTTANRNGGRRIMTSRSGSLRSLRQGLDGTSGETQSRLQVAIPSTPATRMRRSGRSRSLDGPDDMKAATTNRRCRSGSHCSLEGLERNENRSDRTKSGPMANRTLRVAGITTPTSLNGFSLRSRLGSRQSSEGEVKSVEHESASRSQAHRSSSVRSLEEIATSSGLSRTYDRDSPIRKSDSLPSLGNISDEAILRNADRRQHQRFDRPFSLQSSKAHDGLKHRNEGFSISNERREHPQPHPQGSSMKLFSPVGSDRGLEGTSRHATSVSCRKKEKRSSSRVPTSGTGTTSPTFVGDGTDGSSFTTTSGNDSYEALAVAAGMTAETTATTRTNLSRREQLLELFGDQLSDAELNKWLQL